MIAVATASYSANITVDPELSTHDLPAVRLYNKIMQELPDPSIRPANNVNVPTVIDIEIELQQLVDVVSKQHPTTCLYFPSLYRAFHHFPLYFYSSIIYSQLHHWFYTSLVVFLLLAVLQLELTVDLH